MRLAIGVLTLVVAACGIPATGPPDDAGSQASSTATTVEGSKTTTTAAGAETDTPEDSHVGKKTDFDCPVTIPPQPGFVATEPEGLTYSEDYRATGWPSEYPHEGMVWYGSEKLWTALAIDGNHTPRKSVWWSVNFPGGGVEEQPDVSVTWTRLDTDKPVVIENGGKATNAFTAEEGWFMIAGIDPNQAGCWKVEATYKGATLSYIYENPSAQQKATADTQEVVESNRSKVKGETFEWPDSCPVTMLGKGAFTPSSQTPDGPPELYDAVWYGTPELYTMINPDGKSSENRWLGGEKTFWWSTDFSVSTEPEPSIEVTARRLDGEATYESDQKTHGMRDDIGDFMLVGVTIPEPGCWELTATYRGTSLSYVIWVDPNS